MFPSETISPGIRYGNFKPLRLKFFLKNFPIKVKFNSIIYPPRLFSTSFQFQAQTIIYNYIVFSLYWHRYIYEKIVKQLRFVKLHCPYLSGLIEHLKKCDLHSIRVLETHVLIAPWRNDRRVNQFRPMGKQPFHGCLQIWHLQC